MILDMLGFKVASLPNFIIGAQNMIRFDKHERRQLYFIKKIFFYL